MGFDEKKCPQCAEAIKAEANICRYCGYSFNGFDPSQPDGSSLPYKGNGRGKGCLIALGIFVTLGIIGSLSGQGERAASSSKMEAGESISKNNTLSLGPPAGGNQVKSTAEVPESVPSVGLFGPQANAARSAQQYLEMTGFSRRGLIEQLSSDAGEGYNVEDATAAVDSLTVDWNEQAARSARQYLEMTGFSCRGLIEQLSSEAGSKYAKAQARYGAEQAGAC